MPSGVTRRSIIGSNGVEVEYSPYKMGAGSNANEVFDEQGLNVEKMVSLAPRGYESVAALISGAVLEWCVGIGERREMLMRAAGAKPRRPH